jgi:hypothetical protein
LHKFSIYLLRAKVYKNVCVTEISHGKSMNINELVALYGGQVEFAKRMECPKQAVWHWLQAGECTARLYMFHIEREAQKDGHSITAEEIGGDRRRPLGW